METLPAALDAVIANQELNRRRLRHRVHDRLEPALEESFLKLYGVNVRSLQRPGEAK